jgi:hypothetical protein
MPMICTRRNYVMVGNPQPGDHCVATFVHPEFGGRKLLTTQPIERFQLAVQWALDMADCMAGPLEVVSLESEDEFWRQLITATGFEGLHWDKPPEEQQAGRDLLVSIGVLKP